MTLKEYIFSIYDKLIIPDKNYKENEREMLECDDMFEGLNIYTAIGISHSERSSLNIFIDFDSSLGLIINFKCNDFIEFAFSDDNQRKEMICNLDLICDHQLLGQDIEMDKIKEMCRDYIVKYNSEHGANMPINF